MNISVAILAHNEEASIGALLAAVCAAPTGDHRLLEVIVFDDGSTDATVSIVEAAARQNPVILLRGPSRQGTMVGMRAVAAAAKGDVVVRLDADTTPNAGSDRAAR